LSAGLAGAGVAADDDHLAGSERLADPVSGLRHRQVLGVAHHGHPGGAGGTPFGAALEVTLDRLQGSFRRRLAPRTGCQPGNPAADKDGYVYLSNVNEMTEMVEMMAAARSYQNNVEVVNTARQLTLRSVLNRTMADRPTSARLKAAPTSRQRLRRRAALS
jgi:hypothetical protein